MYCRTCCSVILLHCTKIFENFVFLTCLNLLVLSLLTLFLPLYFLSFSHSLFLPPTHPPSLPRSNPILSLLYLFLPFLLHSLSCYLTDPPSLNFFLHSSHHSSRPLTPHNTYTYSHPSFFLPFAYLLPFRPSHHPLTVPRSPFSTTSIISQDLPLMESSPLTHTPHTHSTNTHTDPHKQEYVGHLSESNFKGIVIGGTYQHCFENSAPVIAPPCGMEKRVIGVNFAASDHLELRLYLPKDEETKVISLGADWHWINTSPNGYLVSKGLFSSKKKLVCYYLPRHPIEWATESERVGLMSIGLNKVRSIDSCATEFSTTLHHNSSHLNMPISLSMNNMSNMNNMSITNESINDNDRDNDNENERYSGTKIRNNHIHLRNHNNNNNKSNNNNNNNNINNTRININNNSRSNDSIERQTSILEDVSDDKETQYIDVDVDVEMVGNDDMFSHSMNNWSNNHSSSSTLSLPSHIHLHTIDNTHTNAHTHLHQNSIYNKNQIRAQQNRNLSPSNFTDSNLTLENVHYNGDRTDNTADDEDLLLSSLLKSSNADLNCTHIIVFVLEYLLGKLCYDIFSHLLTFVY